MQKRHKVTMTKLFPRIGIFAKPTGENITTYLQDTYDFLKQRGHEIVFDINSAHRLPHLKVTVAEDATIGNLCDLAVIIGGDGSLLKTARMIVNHGIPAVGINGGNLGFLADIKPKDIASILAPILDGKYYEEQRVMLSANIIQNQTQTQDHLALNDIVMHHGDIARLIEFQIYINDQFVVDQRADGVITSTPTGSTGYALSGGGPIVYPTLDVITLMPMFPHALNTRPIVIDKNSKIRLVLSHSNKMHAKFSCDGQMHITLNAGDEVHIAANKYKLRLLHPQNYNYFAVLRNKLGWNLKPQE